MTAMKRYAIPVCLSLIVLMMMAPSAQAYIGPGAGFAFVSSFFILFFAFILAFFTLLTWPVRWLFRALLSMRRMGKGRVKRFVIVGLDGQDPELTEQFMNEGVLPNFSRLKEQGSFTKLKTTLPAESPVAWSSFQTGCNPGKHRIFDFLAPNRRQMVPELTSANVRTSPKAIRLGKYSIPLGRPSIQLGRKSQPFWKLLSDHGIFSSILRVPISFPPEKFNGVLLSAMCLPDLQGSQGTYFYYTSNADDQPALTSGQRLALERNGDTYSGFFVGPENSIVPEQGVMKTAFQIEVRDNSNSAILTLAGNRIELSRDRYTDYIRIPFAAGLGISVTGIARFRLLELEPHLRLYVTPIQIDPEKPALPISHPFTYSVYLAKKFGAYSTLGVAEDTSGLNEGILDEAAFLEQCTTIHSEREQMFFDALKTTPRGVVACVFDITDRLQHMFFRCLDEHHPANRHREVEAYRDKIRQLYIDMDELVGRVMDTLDSDTVLLVLSDHGFKPFRRQVNLNRWLMEQGYLSVKPGHESADMLQAIDWEHTQAYAVGFGGIYLNLKDREKHGIVAPAERAALKEEIRERLLSLTDEQSGETPVKQVYDTQEAYSGPYVDEAPDLIAGFRVGYRVAWSCVTGGVGNAVLEDNDRPWSGDHNMNPEDVPGMLFCNRTLARNDPDIMDIAPSVLDGFGVPIPAYMDGRSCLPEKNA